MTLMTGWESLREFAAMQDRMNRMNRLIREGSQPRRPGRGVDNHHPRTAGGHLRRRAQHYSED